MKNSTTVRDWIDSGDYHPMEIIQLLDYIGSKFCIKTISAYAKENGMSYNGVKNNRETTEIFGVKFVITKPKTK